MSDELRFDLHRTYLSIDDEAVATQIDVGAHFWDELIAGKHDISRWLMGAGLTKESPTNWDLHPDGECILILLSGSMDVVVQAADGSERAIELRRPGDTWVTPRGAWHRQIVHTPSSRVFMVAGAGTQMRPV